MPAPTGTLLGECVAAVVVSDGIRVTPHDVGELRPGGDNGFMASASPFAVGVCPFAFLFCSCLGLRVSRPPLFLPLMAPPVHLVGHRAAPVSGGVGPAVARVIVTPEGGHRRTGRRTPLRSTRDANRGLRAARGGPGTPLRGPTPASPRRARSPRPRSECRAGRPVRRSQHPSAVPT